MNSSHANRPISTAMSRTLIGTRGQLMSSMGTQRAQGVGIETAVNVADRPVTGAGGMRGMKTAAGPSRQVQDASYYIGVLNQKVEALTNEIAKLENEASTHDRSVAEFGSLQKRHEGLLSDVRGLEGKLADYNLAMDKARASTDPAELQGYVAELQARNQQLAAEVDRVFVVKKQRDEETKQIELQIQAWHEEEQRKLNMLEPQKLQRYNELLALSRDLTQQQDALQSEVDAVTERLREVEGTGDRSYTEEYEALSKRLNKLEKDHRNLSEELEIWETKDSKELLDKLRARVEAQSKETREAEAAVAAVREQTAAVEKQLRELDEDMNDRKAEADDKDKFDKLRQRDAEMTEFIDNFEENRAATLQDQQKTQDTIVALLEHMSQSLEHEHDMPSKDQLKEMKDEASFREKQFESSQQTVQRLALEKKQREAELQKIETVDEKIQIELVSLDKKMRSMRSDMVEFDDIDGLRRRAAATMTSLSRLLKDYQARRDTIKGQVAQLSAKHDELKAKIAASDEHKTLTALEAKLRTYAQTIFQLQEYVETKGRLTDYKPLKENCFYQVDELNTRAKTRASG